MAFVVDFKWASQAIMDLEVIFSAGPPRLETGQLGPVKVTSTGNGRWHATSSPYFNCGANIDFKTPPDTDETGVLVKSDGDKLKSWFEERYPEERPNVLKGEKWNFTLVKNGRAFNFHILVRDHV